MTFATDIAGDFAAVADGLADVTVSGASDFSPPALRRAVTTKEAAESKGKYTTDDVAFHFAVSEGTPVVGDTITDDDGTWTILTVQKQTLTNRWRCMCRKLAVDSSLTGTIEKRTSSKEPDGSTAYTWADFETDVVAKVHEDSLGREIRDGRRAGHVTGKIYFQTNWSLDHQGYRFVDSDNVVYTFVSDQERDSITGLYSVNFERYT